METKNKLTETETEKISGGTAEEYDEISRFVKAHDPEYADIPEDPFMNEVWLNRHFGITRIISSHDQTNTYFTDDGKSYTHAELMVLLKKKYGD